MLSCHLHDFVEIACLYQMRVRLTFKDKRIEDGFAQGIVMNEFRQECLLMKIDAVEQQFVLDEIQSMQALVKNPHFDLIEFG